MTSRLAFILTLSAVTLIPAIALQAKSGASAGEISATLTPKNTPATMAPLLPVTLSTAAPAGVYQTSLQDITGGPTYIFPISLQGKKPSETTVHLPPLAPRQTYTLTLLSQTSSPQKTAVTLEWPTASVNRRGFFKSGIYEPFRYDLPQWSDSVKYRMLLLAGGFCIGLFAILLIRNGWIRAVFFLLLGGGVFIFTPSIINRDTGLLVEQHKHRSVLRTRRTLTVSSGDLPAGCWIPLYDTPRQFATDDLKIHFDPEPSISLTLKPSDVRIFARPLKNE